MSRLTMLFTEKIRRLDFAGIKNGNTGKAPENNTSSALLSKAVQKSEDV